MIETQRSGRISEGSKLAMINSGISRSSASMEIPSPPVSWTARRQKGDNSGEITKRGKTKQTIKMKTEKIEKKKTRLPRSLTFRYKVPIDIGSRLNYTDRQCWQWAASPTWSPRDGLEGSRPSPVHPSGTIPAL
ncbi:hypothetical protein OUZ56_001677 [Daphnia magna]|uniref:Uncharacterized protein n=1 Tax=Daphnia magna TaxID=35525 RepID=A0ABR0A3U3_9CRUS|nr:hypothetical protein OUZ56_001677 [Daphnia magna]